ncbi:MAG: CNNM domain-containing protein [Marinifilaceae bacterium]|jgi:CBS domain containing-hemolysin-like protein
MEILLFYLAIALGVSFLCSLLEAVILSITPSFVARSEETSTRKSHYLKQFKEKIDQPLAAILTLNTFAHTLGAAGVGAEAQRLWGNEYLTLASALLTILILILSEIIPKTLGAMYWRKLVSFTVYTLLILLYSPLYPIIILCQGITGWIRKGAKTEFDSREEISALARLGMVSGEFRQTESLIIQNLMRFDYLRAKDIMTPRVVVHMEDEDTFVKRYSGEVERLPFSRIPVFKENMDNVSGYILKNELFGKLLNRSYKTRLKEFKRPIPIVVDVQSISSLYEKLTSENEMIALVVDEYGGTAGIVTMEDIIETILGLEIVDELDNIEDMRHLAREKWKRRARHFEGKNAHPEEEPND